MTPETLRSMMKDKEGELRRGAVLAMAMKDDQAHLPDLITALLDEEEPVVRAARAGLKAISGEDFGPKPGARISLIGRRRRKPGSTGSASRSNRRFRASSTRRRVPRPGWIGLHGGRGLVIGLIDPSFYIFARSADDLAHGWGYGHRVSEAIGSG